MEALFENYNPLFEGRSGNWDVDLRNFLEFYLQELHNETNCSSMINFSQAAIVLQKSANVYERKVDYLWQLVMQLLDVVKLSKTSFGAGPSNDEAPKEPPVQQDEEQSSKKLHGRKPRSQKQYLLQEFSQVNNKVSAKSLDMPLSDRTTSKTTHTLTRSGVFGRMVNIKKKRLHELYVFDKNEECMGKKDDFRLSWSLNHCCTLIEDPTDESIVNPPPVSNRLSGLMDFDPTEGIPSPGSATGCADDEPAGDGQGLDLGSPNPEVSSEQSPNQEVPQGQSPDPALAGSGEPGAGELNPSEPVPSQGFVLPDTPPDSQGLQDAPVVNTGEPVVMTPVLGINEEERVTRRVLRDRNVLLEGCKFSPLNYLFSSSVLQSLDDTTDSENVSVADRGRNQARKNCRKGKRRFQEILDDDEVEILKSECGRGQLAVL